MMRNGLGTIVAIVAGLVAALFASFLLRGPETDPAVPERGVALSSADAEVMVVFISSPTFSPVGFVGEMITRNRKGLS